MTFQYFKTLMDKSKERLVYLVERIIPSFSKKELSIMLSDLSIGSDKKTGQKNNPSKTSLKNFSDLKIVQDSESDYLSLTDEQLQILYRVFISKEISNRIATKWRFYQHLNITQPIDIKQIQVNDLSKSRECIDFLIRTHDKKTIFVAIFEILTQKSFNTAIDDANQFAVVTKTIPDSLLIVVNKTYRDIPLNETYEIADNPITPELWVEWTENIYPFNSEDLLIINDDEFAIAAYNFSGMKDLLDYVYKNTTGGQIVIYRQRGFFSENLKEKPEPELIWKGLMLKK